MAKKKAKTFGSSVSQEDADEQAGRHVPAHILKALNKRYAYEGVLQADADEQAGRHVPKHILAALNKRHAGLHVRKRKSGQDGNILGQFAVPGGHAGFGQAGW